MTISHDHRALLIDGRRTLILSGAVHYPRSTPAMWPGIFRHAKKSGLNTIETYVFWNLHERRPGVLDFSGRLDLVHFCRLAQAEGLHVILRIGPYICAETNFGGLPGWLRDVPGIRMRTDNEPFKREMARWVRLVSEVVRPLSAANGGPIILGQIENEYDNIAATYGEDGRRYLQWCVDLAKSLDLGIPWITCAAGRAAEAGQDNAVASADGSLETINAFRAHEMIPHHFRAHPRAPALWTENWTGWYQTWGGVLPKRHPEELAYATARFFAAGGSGVNYFLWHGGTNFGRESMYLLTTAYEFGAPLDEYGLPTTKSLHLARLNHALTTCAAGFIDCERPDITEAGPAQVVCAYSSGLAFLCNDATEPAAIRHGGKDHTLAPRSVRIVTAAGKIIFDSGDHPRPIRRTWKTSGTRLAPFVHRAEPLPSDWPVDLQSAVVAAKPVEQLLLTRDETDYCWYETDLVVSAKESGTGELLLERVADIVHVFIDGRLAVTTPGPLRERRGKLDAGKFTQTFTLDLPAGRHRLSILACALGLIKGDWMIGYANMADEHKGLWAPVRWRGRKLAAVWHMQPGLLGERTALFSDAGALATWKKSPARPQTRPLSWWRTTFARPKSGGPFALDLGGMTKGLVWLNGRCLGRYWNIVESDPMGPWMGWMKGSLDAIPSGVATQRHYHVPADWLREHNSLVLFEELGGDPASIRLQRRA
ncbi:MAG: beta-galactosidase [Opitutaceae bacterium]|jgi:hypothetical protein